MSQEQEDQAMLRRIGAIDLELRKHQTDLYRLERLMNRLRRERESLLTSLVPEA